MRSFSLGLHFLTILTLSPIANGGYFLLVNARNSKLVLTSIDSSDFVAFCGVS